MSGHPGTSAAEWMEREGRVLLNTYAKLPIVVVDAEGNEVIAADGRRYLDLYGGHAVTILGHRHPAWVAALSEQLRQLTFYSNVCYSPVRTEAAERLLAHCYPGKIERVFFASSGAEANETALKIARRATGRRRIVATTGGFHGRTIGALSITGVDGYREAMVPNLDSFTDFVPFGELAPLETLRGEEVAAFLLEPIQSMAGVRVANEAYYRGLREWCERNGALLIFDEVQTAPARTGRWFAGEHWGVAPDLMTTAKGIGGGFPVGVVAVSGPIAERVQVGDQGTTFGGGPLAAAAVRATIEIIEREDLVERAAFLEQRFREALSGLPGCVGIRGHGLLLGFELERPAREVRDALLERGILVGTSLDPRTLRLLPALTLEEEAVDRFAAALREIL